MTSRKPDSNVPEPVTDLAQIDRDLQRLDRIINSALDFRDFSGLRDALNLRSELLQQREEATNRNAAARRAS